MIMRPIIHWLDIQEIDLVNKRLISNRRFFNQNELPEYVIVRSNKTTQDIIFCNKQYIAEHDAWFYILSKGSELAFPQMKGYRFVILASL